MILTPIVHFAITFESRREMMDPVIPQTKQNIANPSRLPAPGYRPTPRSERIVVTVATTRRFVSKKSAMRNIYFEPFSFNLDQLLYRVTNVLTS
jgi:hypothetical protein